MKSITFIILTIAILYSCQKEKIINCDPYETLTSRTYIKDSSKTWIPFIGNEQLIFADSKGNQITFTGNGYEKQTYFWQTDDNCNNCRCRRINQYQEGISLKFISNQVPWELNYHLSASTFYKKHDYITLIIQNGLGPADFIRGSLYLGNNSAYLLDSIAVNGVTYYDVYKFQKAYIILDMGVINDSIYTYYNKNQGIVAFVDSDSIIWNLK